MLALVSHDACCMWHECMGAAMHRAATTNQIQEVPPTVSDRSSFAANETARPPEAQRDGADTVECLVDGTRAFRATTPGLRQSCELRHAVRQQLLSFNHHRVELFFNGFPNCAPDEGDACNDPRPRALAHASSGIKQTRRQWSASTRYRRILHDAPAYLDIDHPTVAAKR
jgi:hypothetical protein